MTELRKGILENHERVIELEETLEKTRQYRRDAILEQGTLKLATNNIYYILLHYRKTAGVSQPKDANVSDKDLENQLMRIAEYITDLHTVTEQLKLEGICDEDTNSAHAMRGSKPPLII
jgi:hypothetical protein